MPRHYYDNYGTLPYASSPYQIERNFLDTRSNLRYVYNTTSMTRSEDSAIERGLVAQAVDQLMLDARSYSYSERASALRTIYNNSEMTSSEYHRIQDDMLRQDYYR
jgi:hypothetical protein